MLHGDIIIQKGILTENMLLISKQIEHGLSIWFYDVVSKYNIGASYKTLIFYIPVKSFQ